MTTIARASVALFCAGPVIMLITLIVTYGLAVGLGHVEPWLPMISDLQVLSPECFVSRVGMPVSTLFMQFGVVLTCVWLEIDKERPAWLKVVDIAVAVVTVACLCGFMVVGAVSEVKNAVVHEAGAVTAFVGLFAYFVVINVRFWRARRRLPLSRACFATRVVATTTIGAALLGGIALVTINGFATVRTACAILEWLAGGAVSVNFLSLAHEIRVDFQLHSKPRDDPDALAVNEAAPLLR